jgi:hypothetical protein
VGVGGGAEVSSATIWLARTSGIATISNPAGTKGQVFMMIPPSKKQRRDMSP